MCLQTVVGVKKRYISCIATLPWQIVSLLAVQFYEVDEIGESGHC